MLARNYPPLDHRGSNDFNAPIMSLFKEINTKLTKKKRADNPRNNATEVLTSRFARINENITH